MVLDKSGYQDWESALVSVRSQHRELLADVDLAAGDENLNRSRCYVSHQHVRVIVVHVNHLSAEIFNQNCN